MTKPAAVVAAGSVGNLDTAVVGKPVSIADALTAQLAFTIPEFVRLHRISRAHFYALVRQGKGPRLMRLGTRRLVSAEAAADWRKAMEGTQ